MRAGDVRRTRVGIKQRNPYDSFHDVWIACSTFLLQHEKPFTFNAKIR